MKHLKVIGIDLAKYDFQVCVLDQHGQVLMNKHMRCKQLSEFLAKQERAIVAVEACSGAHYWGRKAKEFGHEEKIIPTRQVQPYRQGHKTDGNDALAIANAARQAGLKTVGLKSVEQQSIQSDKRVQEHLSDQLTQTGNMIRGLVAEFGLLIPKGKAGLKREVPKILEDAENGLLLGMRASLNEAWEHWQRTSESLSRCERILLERVKELEPCGRLAKLEGVAHKNAIGLYVSVGDHFKNGREAAACIGVTPRQESSGGKIILKGIGKFRGNQRLRSSLILGARSMVNALMKRAPRTAKERWLKDVIERRGPGRAAVALANKNIRTAWSMLHHNTAYVVEPISS